MSDAGYGIALIRGDGIGAELVESAAAVLERAAAPEGCQLVLRDEQAGAGCFVRTGVNIEADTLERLRTDYDAVLKGPVGLPDVRREDGTEAGLLGGVLRTELDTYANVRPIQLLPGVRAPVTHDAIDYVIVRENTEGLYASRGNGVANRHAASDVLFMTRPGIERVVRFAFEVAQRRSGAPEDGVSRVTCVDKSNVLKSFALFRAIFDEVAGEFPEIAADHLYSDAAAQALVAWPGHFDVLVMENFLGDLLSDLGAGTIGGLGMCPAANVGDRYAYFEPVHGSAPDIAGKNAANPTSQVLAAALMLDHLGELAAAERIRDAVRRAYADGAVRLDSYGRPECGTTGVTSAILDRL
ncbi:MAG: isocitrate/isopropylmalate dehydrogenase family protein [Streptosporangiales bacterium]